MSVEGEKVMTRKKRDYNGYFSQPVAASAEEAEQLKEEVVTEEEPVVEEPVAEEAEEVDVEEVTVIARVIPNKLNVRIEPQKVDGNVVGILKKGDRITVHTAYHNPTWAYISAEVEKGINVDGFVMKGFIEEVKED